MDVHSRLPLQVSRMDSSVISGKDIITGVDSPHFVDEDGIDAGSCISLCDYPTPPNL